MELLILLAIFIFLAILTIIATYQAGLIAGLLGVLILTLYNAWVYDLTKDFGKPNGNSSSSSSLKELRPIFLKNLAVLLFCFYGVHHVIAWIKTEHHEPIGFYVWLLLVFIGYLSLFHNQQIR